MQAAIERDDPQIVIEKLARNKISEAQADAILRAWIAESRPRGVVERIVDALVKRLHGLRHEE